VFYEIGEVPSGASCLNPAEKRALALLPMVVASVAGTWYQILKGVAEYVPGDSDGAAGSITIDTPKTKDIRPEKVNDALRWLKENNLMVRKYFTLWDTHQEQFSQPSQDIDNANLPSGFPTIPCPAGKASDTRYDVQGLVLGLGEKTVPQTHTQDNLLKGLVAEDILPRPSKDATSTSEESSKSFLVYYNPNTEKATENEHCMEMLRSVHRFPYGKGGYLGRDHGEQQLPAMEHAAYVKVRMV
jgi:hypothetical protein